jgi:signal transduction histidine kinase
MEDQNNLIKFIKTFSIRDGLLRSISLIGSTFTIAAISLLPGFGVKGLLIASSIQLLLSGILEIPTSIAADKFGRSRILKISLALKILVSIALGFAIYFASKGNSQFVWYAFFLEAFVDAISNTLLSGSYQVAYLTLYDQISINNKNKPPLFLKSYEFGTNFRILFPILFVIFITAIFILFEGLNQNLYNCAYIILSSIIIARVSLFYLVSSDFKTLNSNKDKTRITIREGLFEVYKIAINKKTTFLTYSITALLNFICILYLTGQAIKSLKDMNFTSHHTWMTAIGSSVLIYLLRTFATIKLLPKISSNILNILVPFFGFILFLGGVYLTGIEIILKSNLGKFSFFIILTTILFIISDAISKSIESNLKNIVQSEFKATWLSLGNTLAYFIFGFCSFMISQFAFTDANIIIGIIIGLAGLFILFSNILAEKGFHLPAFKEVLRAQLLKALSFIVILIFIVDLISYSVFTQNKMKEIIHKTSETVLLGIKSSVIQGDLIEASNFLYSLKKGNFISCFKLNLKLSETNDCELNNSTEIQETSHVVDIKYDENTFGKIILYFNFSPIKEDLFYRLIFDIIFAFFLYSILFYIFQLLSKTVSSEVELLQKLISGGNSQNKQFPFKISEFNDINLHLIDSIKLKEKNQFQNAMINIASQVSHDIRSPLTALGLMTENIPQIPEDKRIIIRSAVNRINDIANQLLQKSKDSKHNNQTNIQNIENNVILKDIELIGPLVDRIVSEKRVQFRDFEQIEISIDLKNTYGLFIAVNSIELKRVISNLINNSIEALPNKMGQIKLLFTSDDTNIYLNIEDSGIGIPNHILDRLGEKGFSYGKEDEQSGNGLGIYHAKKIIESSGGTFKILSELGTGTKIILSFPKVKTPNWFVEKINLELSTEIITLDDDISIHQIWKSRFHNLNPSIKITSFTSAEKLKEWYKNQENFINSNRVYLFDFELLGQKETGLNTIQELGLSDNCFLVTSRYDEDNVRFECNKYGIKLIPKSMAGFVPIEISKTYLKVKYDLCLIDDDKSLIQCVWETVAKSKGLNIKMFTTPFEFFENVNSIDRQTPIYVDVSLGNNINGTEVAKEIHKLGFTEINLATGYEADALEVPSFINRVCGKDFPLAAFE